MTDGGDQALLAVIPACAPYFGLGADAREFAVARHKQFAGKAPAVGEDDIDAIRARLIALSHDRRDGNDIRSLQHGAGQYHARMPVLGHPAQRLALGAFTDLAAIEMQAVWPRPARARAAIGPAIADHDVFDTGRVGPQLIGDTQGLEQAPGRKGEGRGTAVEFRGQLGVDRQCINHRYPQPGLIHRQGQGQAGQTTTDNDCIAVEEIVFAHEAKNRRFSRPLKRASRRRRIILCLPPGYPCRARTGHDKTRRIQIRHRSPAAGPNLADPCVRSDPRRTDAGQRWLPADGLAEP